VIEAEIRMHDLLRDLGRHLANDPRLPRRIWRTEDFEDLFQQSSIVTEVRGISMYLQRDEVPSFSGCKIRNMQLLDIDYTNVWEDVLLENIMNAMHSPNLIWLRTHGPAYSRMSSWFPLKKLRVLEVVDHWRLQSLWQEESQVPLQLRELIIKAPLSEIPKSIVL